MREYIWIPPELRDSVREELLNLTLPLYSESSHFSGLGNIAGITVMWLYSQGFITDPFRADQARYHLTPEG